MAVTHIASQIQNDIILKSNHRSNVSEYFRTKFISSEQKREIYSNNKLKLDSCIVHMVSNLMLHSDLIETCFSKNFFAK